MVCVVGGLVCCVGSEADTDALFGPAFFLMGNVVQDLPVDVGQRCLDDAARPEPAAAYHVEFGGVQAERDTR